MARLYANENFPRPVVEALRRLGHDVLTTVDAGRAGTGVPDLEVLRFASREGRAIVTLNRRDFIHLHESERGHAGIIVCTIDPDVERHATRIHAAIHDLGDLRDRLVRVNRPRPGEADES